MAFLARDLELSLIGWFAGSFLSLTSGTSKTGSPNPAQGPVLQPQRECHRDCAQVHPTTHRIKKELSI